MAPNYTTPGELMRQENNRLLDEAKKKGDWEYLKASVGLRAGALADAMGAFNGAAGPAKGAMGNPWQSTSNPQSQSQGRPTWEGGGESAFGPWEPPTESERDRYRATMPTTNQGASTAALGGATTGAQPETFTWNGMKGTRTVGPKDVTYNFGENGSAIVHGGASNMREPGSYFRGGFNPQDAARAQQGQPGGNFGFQPNYQQIGQDTYMNDRGLMIQGDQGTADYFYRFRHAPSYGPPLVERARPAAAQTPMPMPEAPKGGWKTKRAVYQAQMDAYNKAQDRAKAMEIEQMRDARQGERFGFDQEQARQAMDLQRAQLGLQADQNIVNRAKTLADMEQAAIGTQLQQIQLGAQQEYLRALQSGDPAAIARAEAALQALNPKGRGRGGAKDAAGLKPVTLKFGDDEFSGITDANGNVSIAMPQEVSYFYENVYPKMSKEEREIFGGQPIKAQLAQMAAMRRLALSKRAEEEAKKQK